jgi:H+/gluconate symporter-like permease
MIARPHAGHTTTEEIHHEFHRGFAGPVFLMLAAYRGYSVILMAPLAALGAVLLTDPSAVAPAFSGLFMDKMVGFIKLYFPVFLLGSVFGKLVEMSGFSKSIVAAVIRFIGEKRAIAVIVAVCALLTYGGVSFVVVFAVYPFAAELFRQSNIPKRLIPGTVALGAFSFTMDALPGTPQIQNIIPTTFFKTTAWAAPALGICGAVFITLVGLAYLEWRRRSLMARGEGYGTDLRNEPEHVDTSSLPSPWLAIAPAADRHQQLCLHPLDSRLVRQQSRTASGRHGQAGHHPDFHRHRHLVGGSRLAAGHCLCRAHRLARHPREICRRQQGAIAGAMLAAMNTASEYGFGAVIAALPGFMVIGHALQSIPNPLVNAAVTVSTLAGVTGSASGGMSIALAAMGEQFISACQAAGIPLEVLHRVVAMASGGMDTLPHNGAVITLLAVTGLTHREAYRDIFAVTMIKTLAVFFVITVFYLTGLV